VAEDWRVTVKLRETAQAGRALTALHEHQVGDDVRERLGGRVAVSDDGDTLFLYADTEAAAREAESVVTAALGTHGIDGSFRVDRWHHDEEDWEDASTQVTEKAEHERLEQEETAEAEATGVAQWEIRIEFTSHHDARAFEKRLTDEGFDHFVRRWKYVLIGTNDQDDAETWEQRLQDELPAGATIHVEPGSGLAWEYMPASPFAVFGGLAS
jgi:hypothetical protein